jgi:hypothetical protein
VGTENTDNSTTGKPRARHDRALTKIEEKIARKFGKCTLFCGNTACAPWRGGCKE